MSTRSERDRQKSSQERHQSILSQLLKDEDNKYCVDCDAKGPRWASWNLGIFLCIRCAGIHRNLGVHISKVKSVNLDSWTGEQVAMVQEMGNSRARAVYEANLPDNFRRPQTDSGLEAFIRGKYEQKRYIAKEWIPPQRKVQPTYEEPKKEKKRSRPKPQTSQNMPVSTASVQAKAEEPKAAPKPAPVPSRQEAAAADLLSLDADPVPQSDAGQADLFGDFVANTLPTETPLQPTLNAGDPSNTVGASSPATTTAESQPAADGIDLFGESSGGEQQRKAQKEDILKLYGSSSTSSPQMFGVPGGMYMAQQAPMMQNNMMPNAAMMQVQPQQQQQQMPQQMQQQMPQQMPQQQQMMMGGGVAGMQAGYMGMPQNTGGMMGQYQQHPQQQQPPQQQPQQQQQQQAMYGNMGNMNMYAMQQPQFQQIQNQMASMALGPTANSFQQQPTPIAAGGTPAGNFGNWGGQPMGQTLSGNLWK